MNVREFITTRWAVYEFRLFSIWIEKLITVNDIIAWDGSWQRIDLSSFDVINKKVYNGNMPWSVLNIP